MSEIIAGRHPVVEALRAGRTVNKIMIAKGTQPGALREIITLARERGIPLVEVERKTLDAAYPEGNHQGVVAHASPKEYMEVPDILNLARARGEDPFLIILDEVEDPRNLGAILRSAEAAGVHGVVIPKRRSAALTTAVAKAAAGAMEYVPVARVSNLVQTMEWLKSHGCWVIGSQMNAPKVHWEADLKGPIALVIGGEGKGLGRLVQEKCDFTVQLPLKGKVGSLNAAVAASILMYEVLRQRSGRP